MQNDLSMHLSISQLSELTAATVGPWLGGEIALFAVELVVLKGEKCELGAVFVSIGRFFEDQHILVLDGGRWSHDPFNLCLRHAVGDLVIIGESQLRAGECVSVAARRKGEQRGAEQRKYHDLFH